MPPSTHHAEKTSVSTALARDRLGAFAISSSIASSVAPLTVIAVIVPVATASTGLLGFPIAILLIAAILMIFAVGYLAQARHIPNAGAFGAFVAHGISRPFGVGASWAALVMYNFFQLCCYGAFGALVGPLLSDWIGLPIAWWVPAFVAWALVAVLGANAIQVAGYVLMVLVVAETLLVAAYSAAVMLGPGFAFNGAAMDITDLSGPNLGVLVVLGATSFAGVEQSVVYIEESKNRQRTIPLATYLTIAAIGAVYWFGSWVQISAPGPQILDRAGEEGMDLFFNEAAVVLGAWAVTGGKILLGTGTLAAAIAFHNAITRYTFSLGREGVLPRLFSHTTLGGAPRNASYAQTGLAFVVLLVYAIKGWDPLVHLFFWGSTTGGLGVLLLYTLTSVSVVCFFARRENRRRENVWRRAVVPAFASVILLVVSYLAVVNLAALYGVEPGTGPAVFGPIALAVAFTAGIAWALILKKTSTAVYQGIGRGTSTASAGDSDLASVLTTAKKG